MLRPVSIVTVKAPLDRNGNSRKAYIVLAWDEEKQRTSTTIVKDYGEGMLVTLAWDLPNVEIHISAGEFKRLFKG